MTSITGNASFGMLKPLNVLYRTHEMVASGLSQGWLSGLFVSCLRLWPELKRFGHKQLRLGLLRDRVSYFDLANEPSLIIVPKWT